MRVLFATGSPASYMAPPLLGDEQVNCGPDWTDERRADGRWKSFKTPLGEYSLAAIAAKLGSAQKPDLVVCLVDASWRNQPHGLGAFKCPRVLLIADTHHMRRPITGMLRYATSEPFTRTVLLYDRHHAPFFFSAGLKNLFWFPGLTFPHSDAAVRAARTSGVRRREVVLVGQSGAFHPRRTRLVEACRKAGLPMTVETVSQAEGLKRYGSSLVGFNASLNGDLNLRVFEILASGAALLTDRLAPTAGLDTLLRDGTDYVSYGNEEELVRRASDLSADRERTSAIGQAGAQWFDEHLNQKRRAEAFRALCVDGIGHPAFAFLPSETGRTLFNGAADRLVSATIGYEFLQEKHRVNESVTVAVSASVPAEISRLCATLPRVQCVPDAPGVVADLAVMVSEDTTMPLADTRRIWCWDLRAGASTALDDSLDRAGWRRNDPQAPWFSRRSAEHLMDGRKHVLLYTDDPESGGVAQYNHTLLLALARAGYRVSCVQSRCENPLISEQRAAGVHHHWIEYHTGRDFARTLSDPEPAETLFCEDPPDLIIFSDCCPLSNLAARGVALRHGIPFIVVIGFVGDYLAKQFAPLLPTLKRQHDTARSVVAVSQENRELLVKLFGTPADRCRVIHYGRPEKFFAPRNPAIRARLRAELQLPDDAVVCLTTARLAAVKGHRHQLQALELLKSNPGADCIHLVWAGDGEERAALEKEIARGGLKQRVHLLGHRWDVADWYDAADIFVLTSHTEGMPLSIMEAMAKGLPVVATAVSGVPEELGDTGVLLPDPRDNPAGTEQLLADTLYRWASDSQVRTSDGRLAWLRANFLFREHRMLDEITVMLAQAMESRATTGVKQDSGTERSSFACARVVASPL